MTSTCPFENMSHIEFSVESLKSQRNAGETRFLYTCIVRLLILRKNRCQNFRVCKYFRIVLLCKHRIIYHDIRCKGWRKSKALSSFMTGNNIQLFSSVCG